MLNNFMKSIVFLSIVILGQLIAFGDGAQPEYRKLEPDMVKQPPKIDAVLDDAIWAETEMVDGDFISYNPYDGAILSQKTKVWVAYDPENIYVAFYCYDKEPDKIKSMVTKRDSLWNDDWVGFALDTMGNNQQAYEFFVNPHGAQADILNVSGSGENSSSDFVWYSAGRIVKDGYIVEVRIPLKGLKYKSGTDIDMKIIFWRKISRDSMSGAWPLIKPGGGILNSSTDISFKQIDFPSYLELIPSTTYSALFDRESPDKWSEADGLFEIGISGLYAISSSVSAEFTVNPDFSQVESDQFQVLSNRRYPTFYSEKRPFFMGVGDHFDLSGSGENMRKEMHSRKIVDPAWGAKVAGDLGTLSFALLASGDEWQDGEETIDSLQRNFTLGRLKYKLSGDNFVGLFYSGVEHGDYFNQVYALDLKYKFGDYHQLMAQYINTTTSDLENNSENKGEAYSIKYDYSSSLVYAFINYESYSDDFQMDTAFYNRVGIERANCLIHPFLKVKSDSIPWLQRITPMVYAVYIKNNLTGLEDKMIAFNLECSLIKNGIFIFGYDIINEESWVDTVYDRSGGMGLVFAMQFTDWFYFQTEFTSDDYIYYSRKDPFLGDRVSFNIQSLFNIGDNLSLNLEYEFLNLEEGSNQNRVIDEHILFGKLTYQFDKHLFVRAIAQYNSYAELLLIDFLASYELIPGTVLHIGYGSLNTKEEWDSQLTRWRENPENGHYYSMRQSVFIKASYRFQL